MALRSTVALAEAPPATAAADDVPSSRGVPVAARARASGDVGDPGRPRLPASLRLRHDNDFFGAQDRGYTSGLLIDWAPSALGSPDGGGGRVFYLGQKLFTPADGLRRDLILDDRPYAGVLFAGVGWWARRGRDIVRSDVQLGLVGPSARGQASQERVHALIDGGPFRGWSQQLRDEPVFGLVHNRFRRWSVGGDPPVSGGPGQEVIVHWGGRAGNLFTWANAGVEWRIGRDLPDDSGSSPVQPGGPEPRSSLRRSREGWRWAVFATGGARLVARDLTLDGNTFRSSHRVDRRVAVAEAGYGFVVEYERWQLSFGRYHRTREFAGQRDRPIYGALTIARGF